MTQRTQIKTLEDGSIDHAHYIARSHVIRSQVAHRAFGKLRRAAFKVIGTSEPGTVQHAKHQSNSALVSKMSSAIG